jgi:hypothetical protein
MEIESPGYRLIFIDIDGVLNRSRTGDTEDSFVHELMERFARLVRETGATLVLSSAWRLTKVGRLGARTAFLGYGLPPPISCTPRMRGPRGNEVLAWLQQNTLNVFVDELIEQKHRLLEHDGEFTEKHYTLPVPIKVAQFVALDDRDFRTRRHGGYYRRLLTEQGHFVPVDSAHGISDQQAAEAVRLLLAPLAESISMQVESKTPPPSPTKGYCLWCEKRVRPGTGIEDRGALFCSLDCAYRYRGAPNISMNT